MGVILNLAELRFFTADLALYEALEAVDNLLPGNFLLCMDSLSAVQSLQ
jgi:hypothetical protein